MSILKVLFLDKNAQKPTRAHPDDAGFDLYVSQDIWIRFNEFVDVPTGIAVELPRHTYGRLVGRSSTLREHRLFVNEGIIDYGYRGPLFAGVWNLSDQDVLIRRGDRIAQLIIHRNDTEYTMVSRVDKLGSHTRGQAGFGSSGR